MLCEYGLPDVKAVYSFFEMISWRNIVVLAHRSIGHWLRRIAWVEWLYRISWFVFLEYPRRVIGCPRVVAWSFLIILPSSRRSRMG